MHRMRVIDWDMHIIRYVYRMRNIKKEDDAIEWDAKKVMQTTLCVEQGAIYILRCRRIHRTIFKIQDWWYDMHKRGCIAKISRNR